MRCIRVKLSTISICEAQNITGELNCHALHTQAYPETRNLILSRVLDSSQLAFNSSASKPRRNDDTLKSVQAFRYILLCKVIRQYFSQFQLTVVISARMGKTLAYRHVRIVQLYIFSD